MSVCLFVHTDISGTMRTSELYQISILVADCCLREAVVRSPFSGVAIRYVLPVLWKTSCFAIMGVTVAVSLQCCEFAAWY